MLNLKPPTEWPFAVVALSPELRGGIVEPTFEHGCRRMQRLLHQADAGHFANDLPTSRTPFAVEKKDSHSVYLRAFSLGLNLAWLRVRASDMKWPEPVIVGALGHGETLVSPFLAPDSKRSRAWADRLRQRGVPPGRILELPVVDRRSAGSRGQVIPTFRDVLDSHSVVEEVVRMAVAGEEVSQVA